VTEHRWLPLTARELTILIEALSSILAKDRANNTEVRRLIQKVAHAESHPNITVGVHGGLVQWTLGNPFPIRIYDYDGYDLPDLDERGQPCRISVEPPDAKTLPA